MKKIFLILLVGLILIIPSRASAVSYHSYGVTEEEMQLMEEDVPQDNIFDELYYRLVLKDTRDAVDYIILGVIIVLMLVVLVALNKKTYVIPGNVGVFEEDSIDVTQVPKQEIVEGELIKKDE